MQTVTVLNTKYMEYKIISDTCKYNKAIIITLPQVHRRFTLYGFFELMDSMEFSRRLS